MKKMNKTVKFKYMLSARDIFNIKHRIKRQKELHYAEGKHKNKEIARLLDLEDFQAKGIIRIKDIKIK